jgi:hypothetical protein
VRRFCGALFFGGIVLFLKEIEGKNAQHRQKAKTKKEKGQDNISALKVCHNAQNEAPKQVFQTFQNF